MKVVIISGFLGAGKTTFIKELKEKRKDRFAIIENDYADVGIDKDILQSDQSQIWELSEGCICCSNKKDFASNVITISNGIDPDYLIIEPTGVGYLSSILETVKQVAYERIQIMQPITIVDAHSFLLTYTKYQSLYEDQIKNSCQIVFSKLDITNQDEILQAKELILQINNQATIYCDSYHNQNDIWWDKILNTDLSGKIISTPTNDIKMNTFSVPYLEFNTLGTMVNFFERLIRNEFGDIYRAKGFAKINDQAYAFNVVDKIYSIEESDSSKYKAVFIGPMILNDKLSNSINTIVKKIKY